MTTAFSNLPAILQPKEEDIQMMLSAGVHTGTRNSDSQMLDYIWRRRNDGVHILNIGKTWKKLMLAARVIVAIENPNYPSLSGKSQELAGRKFWRVSRRLL